MEPAKAAPYRSRIEERLQGIPRVDFSDHLPPFPTGGPMDLARFLTVAECMARTLGAVHARGVTHRDIRPENFRLRDGGPVLSGFRRAVTFDAESAGFTPLDRLPADLSFIAPEQTGRVNRPVDHRADLYSLGATLYTMATGRAPFPVRDRSALIHAHLASEPKDPGKLAPWMPPILSRIVLRLLSKEPDDRYQSADGLADDLGQLRDAAQRKQTLDSVTLRAADRVLRPRRPRRCHGRDNALGELLAVLDSVTKGGMQSVFIGGEAGVGKTSLVNALQRPTALRAGCFVRGKCEQFQRERPLLAPLQALGQLLDLLSGESKETIDALRSRLQAGLGAEAGVLHELLPELATIAGAGAPQQASDPRDAQVRLKGLLVRLVRAIASPARPLVLVLDDLQWADKPTLDFVAALREENDLDGLLLIGVFRSDETESAPALQRLAEESSNGTHHSARLRLGNLAPRELDELVAEMLGTAPEEISSLADEFHQATQGNPFHAIELVEAMHRDGALAFDAKRQRWNWDASALAVRERAGDIVEFLTRNLSDLPPATGDALAAAAMLGGDLTLGLLACATGGNADKTAAALLPALERNVLITPDAEEFTKGDSGTRIAFRHDRMQQAAASLRDGTWRVRQQLAMARRLIDEPAARFRAAEQYAGARTLLEDPQEKENVAALFLDAGRSAREAAAFAAAHRFIRLALDLLAPDPWHYAPALSWDLHEELHLACYCLPDYAEADAVYAQLCAHAPGADQLAAPAAVQVMSLSNRTRYEEAVRLGAALLAESGIVVPLENPEEPLRGKLDELYRAIDSGALERLPSSGEANAASHAAAKLLNRMVPAAFFFHPAVANWLVVHAARIWADGNYGDARIYPMACLALATIPARGDHATGYRAARAALLVGENAERGVETARARHVFGLFNCHWVEPLENGLAQAREAHDALLRSGELEFACYTFFTSQAALLDTGTTLADLDAENRRALAFAEKTGNRHAHESYTSFRGVIDALGADTAVEAAEIPAANPMAACFHHAMHAFAACLFGNDTAHLHHAETAARLAPYITGFYPTALINFLESLALLSRARSDHRDSVLMGRVASNQNWLAARAADAPVNFAHLHDLVEAERLFAEDRGTEALPVYERAIRRAKAHHRPWHAALATEKAARCYLALDLEQAGHRLLEQARALHEDWGATRKCAALEAEFPFLKSVRGWREMQPHLAAMQRLASIRSVPQLTETTADIVREISGATDVQILAIDADDRWILKAGYSGEGKLSRHTLEEAERKGLVAAAVVRSVLRLMKPLLSEDAVLDARFAGDPRFRATERCALLGVPVVSNHRVVALVILENRRLRGAFGGEMADMVGMLCGQLAVSIENARLYRSLEEKVEQRTRELRLVLDNLPIAVAATTLTSPAAMTFINAQFTRTFGYTLEDLPTVAAWSEKAYPDPAYRREVFREWDEAVFRAIEVKGRVESMEFEVTCKDGTRRDIIFSAVVLDDRLLTSMTDVTERKKAEAALRALRREIERTAFELTENIPVGTFTMVQPPDGGMAYFSFMSTRFLELTGLERAAAEADPMNAFACVHPDDHAEWVRKNAYVFEHKLPFKEECRIIVDGETRWITAESTPRDLPDGSVVWEGVLTDITDRRLAEQKVATSEAQLRKILDNIPIPVAINDAAKDGRISFINEAFTRTFGYTPEDIPDVGAWSRRAYPDEDYRAATFHAWDTAVAEAARTDGTVAPMECRISAKDGRQLDVIINAAALEDMLLVGFVDITARKKAEEELSNAHRNMKLAASAARLGFWELDIATGLDRWDEEMARINGVDLADFDGHWEKFVHPDDYDNVMRETRRMIESDRIFEMDYRIVRPSGEVRHIREHGVVVRDDQGRPRRAGGVMLDITEKVEAAAREKQLAAEHRRDLETKLKTSLTASAVAHEINQPLSAILLQSKLALQQGAEERAALKVIAREAQRVVVTIEKMKTLLRNVQTEHRPIDLAEVVRSALLYNKGMLARLDIDVTQSGLRKPCRITGDDAQLQLALTNILRNSAEAIEESGAEKRKIAIKLVQCEDSVGLSIGDSGPGWSGAEQADTPLTTTKKGGTGIGLYVVRTAVQNHRGTMAFGRSPLGGAEVKISFPRATAKEEQN